MAKSNEAKQRGTKTNQQGLYAKLEPHADYAIEKLVELLDSRNESIRLGAINKILDKCIPDRKAVEVSGKDGQPIPITIIAGSGFVPAGVEVTTAPAGSDSTPAGAF